jgi:hypothetical protein
LPIRRPLLSFPLVIRGPAGSEPESGRQQPRECCLVEKVVGVGEREEWTGESVWWDGRVERREGVEKWVGGVEG